jgi:D-alanine-D-alanine ligase
MRICILSDAYENSTAPTKEYDIQCDPTPYLTEHDCETVYLQKATAVRQIIELSRRGFDVFINLCDGAWDEDRPGIEVVQALERLGLAFTGAGSACYDPTRESMKRVCAAWGLHTPAHVFVENEGEATWRAASLRYPMIVKHPGSYNSIGLTPASRVTSAEALAEQTALMIHTYGGALIEEFIEGREFTVLVAENPDDPQLPMAYTPVEFQFPAGESFKHFDLKWVHYDRMSAIPCTDPVLTERLKQVSREFFLGLGGSGYGRCDIRMDEHGDLYLLEINPNCDVFYPLDSPGSADFILMNDPAGHIGFTRQIIRAAFARQARQRRNWEVQSSSKSNYGMIARRFIPAGQLIEAYEEQPHVLVSKSYAIFFIRN